MTPSAAATFATRDCPHCGSASKRTLLRLDAESIFRSNWSYRPEAQQHLALDGGQTFPIEECGACGFVYAGLLPGPAFLQAVYDLVIDPELARRSNLSPASLGWKMGYLSTLLRLLPDQPCLDVLDYGCGFGPALQLLNAAPAVRALGYETSEARLVDLRQRGLAASGDPAEIAARAPFAAIILDNVLEHVPRPRETMAFIRSVSKPGGLLFVSVPEIGRDSIAAQQQAAVRMDINPWEHLNYFDLPHLDQLLAESGFKPCARAALPGPVDIGLRPSASGANRFMNGLASLRRLVSYVAHGDALASVTGRFYERTH
jgi:SAM-dependent methyltransferase